MIFDGTSVFAGIMIIGLWLVSIVVLLVMLTVRKTPIMSMTLGICMIAQAIMFTAALLGDLFMVAVISALAFITGVFVYHNWMRREEKI